MAKFKTLDQGGAAKNEGWDPSRYCLGDNIGREKMN
jgi:hypothetical protein